MRRPRVHGGGMCRVFFLALLPAAFAAEVPAPAPSPPEPPVFPVVPEGRVLVEVRPGAGEQKAWPAPVPPVAETFTFPGMAFLRLPVAYDEQGIRTDYKPAVMLRAYAEVDIPAGNHRLLLRARGGSRLWVDGSLLGSTRFAVFRGDGHTPVAPIPDPVAPGVCRTLFGDSETLLSYASPGGKRRVVLDVLAGSKNLRPETGESLAAIQLHGTGPFRVLSPSAWTGTLSDEEWPGFAAKAERAAQQLDTERRRRFAASQDAYWRERHAAARKAAEQIPAAIPDAPGATMIDRFLNARLAAARTAAAAPVRGTVNFQRDIQPLLNDRCLRCHAEKQKGGLRLDSREAALKAGDSGSAAIHPGHPDKSHLLTLIRNTSGDDRMPPQGDPLTAEQIALLEKWIAEGAPWNDAAAPPAELPPGLDDAAFARRVYLATAGIAPGAEELRAFLADPAPDKRARLIDRLLSDPRFAGHWVSYWQDVLAENPNILKPELNNTGPFRFWLHESLLDAKPLDRFVTELIQMRGSRLYGGPAGFRMASQNDVPMAEKANVLANAFLGVEMKCARCHDSPYHSTTQRQLFEMAAFLEEKPLKIPATSSVPAAFFEKTKGREPLIRATMKAGDVITAAWPFPQHGGMPETNGLTPREQLAFAITGPLNRRFAEVLANRVWARLFGTGIMHPVHDWEGRSPSHPELLQWLGRELMRSGYDLPALCRTIMNSEAWQRRAAEMPGASDPARRFFTAPLPRRMSAEQVVDTLHAATGQPIAAEPLTFDNDGGQKPETMTHLGQPRRAWEFCSLANERDRPALALPRAQTVTDVLEAFGWRPSRPEPLTDRPEETTPLQPAMLANGTLAAALTRLTDASALTALALQSPAPAELADSLWLQLLNRLPTEAERKEAAAFLEPGFTSRCTGSAPPAPTNEDPDLHYHRITWTNHLRPEATEIKERIARHVRRGPIATNALTADWRERCEDLIWSLVNSQEFLVVP